MFCVSRCSNQITLDSKQSGSSARNKPPKSNAVSDSESDSGNVDSSFLAMASCAKSASSNEFEGSFVVVDDAGVAAAP